MKIYKTGDFEYWYDRSTQCWWTMEIDPKTGYQVKDAHNTYRKEHIIEIVEDEQHKLDQLRAKVGEPHFSSEECEEHLRDKFLKENPNYLMSGRNDDETEDYNQEEIDEEGTVSGIVCNKCGNELPEHTVKDHLDKNHPVHKCPHQLTDQTFLSNTELSDLPENLNQAGFKNVFIIDENTDFSKLPNPFLKK